MDLMALAWISLAVSAWTALVAGVFCGIGYRCGQRNIIERPMPKLIKSKKAKDQPHEFDDPWNEAMQGRASKDER